jgi:hypothetical protein
MLPSAIATSSSPSGAPRAGVQWRFLGMMSSDLPPAFKDKVTPAHRWRMTSMSTITRTQIANVAAMAHGPWLMHLQPHDRIRVLSALATVYSCLGFVRKEVYVLREVLSVVMDLIVSAREEMRDGIDQCDIAWWVSRYGSSADQHPRTRVWRWE